MEQGPLTSPNPAALTKVSGKALFKPSGESSYIDLGIITMSKMDYGAERDDKVRYPIDGVTVLGSDDITAMSPVLNLDGNQWHTQIQPFILAGSTNSNASQSSGTAATVSITAALGRTFDIGARNVTLISVEVSSTGKTLNTDFFFEANKGLIRFPVVAAGIADAATVVVTFDKPAITRSSFTAFTNFNREGTLLFFEMDSRSSVPCMEWPAITGTLSCESAGEGEPNKAKKWSLRFAVSGQPVVLMRLT